MRRKNAYKKTYKYVQEVFGEKQLKESLPPDLLETCPIYKVQNPMI